MHELMFQAGVKGRSERSKLIPCIDNRDDNIIGSGSILYERVIHESCPHKVSSFNQFVKGFYLERFLLSAIIKQL